MSGKRFAFPVLDPTNYTKTRLMELSSGSILHRARDVLSRRAGRTATAAAEHSNGEALYTALHIGDNVRIPLTLLGTVGTTGEGKDHLAASELLVHSPGLAGAFPVSLAELATCRGHFTKPSVTVPAASPSASAATELGALCLLEAVRLGLRTGCVLDAAYRLGRRRHFGVVGTEQLLERGAEIDVRGLQLSFPYHCGGQQAVKRYFDVSREATTHFAPAVAHGSKVLGRYGVAACVGVAEDTGGALHGPCLFWHPSGAPAACLAPVLHGSPLLSVGSVALEYNGPTGSSAMLAREDPRCYMSEGDYDCSTWLTEGLFCVRPGEPWRGKTPSGRAVVLGVCYNDAWNEFDLLLRNTETNEVVLGDDV